MHAKRSLAVLFTLWIGFAAGFSLAESTEEAAEVQPPSPSPDLPADSPARDLTGRIFQWAASYPDEGEPITPDAPMDYRLHIAGLNRVALKADCNQYTAPLRLTDSGFSIGRLTGTRALCSRDSLEDVFLDELKAATGWRLAAEGLLVLTQPDGALHFVEVTEALK